MNLETTNNFKKIVLEETPLIDVRAPIEFEKGAFMNTVNIPIMDDEQRHLIGIEYKKKGNSKATELGHELVSGIDKESKITAWTEFISKNPETLIYCFRGGQRSRITQEWIQASLNREIIRLEGGFKAFRSYLIDAFDPENQSFTPIRLGGHTGSGKTPLINSLDYSIDLEGLANHRGSSFGQYITPQPSQINFENNLAYRLIQKQATGYSHLVFEDEGRHVGKCFIPKIFTDHCSKAPLVVVQVSVEDRAVNIHNEYVTNSQKGYLDTFGDQGMEKWHEYIITSINKASRRLGGDRHKNMVDSVNEAYQHQLSTGDTSHNLDWITSFLKEYYDPMYEYQLEQNKNSISYSGSTKEVIEYLDQLISINK